MLVITELLSSEKNTESSQSASDKNTKFSPPASDKNAAELISSFSNILNYEPENSLFFDIETTGLSAANSMVFLIGAIYFDGKDWQLKQLLAQSAEDERCILEEFFNLARNYHTLIHFNGTTFDIPYVKERACRHGLSHSLNEMDSLDLYQKFRPLKKLLNLPRMNQQTLEQFLKWLRQDQLTGKHMITLFKKYAASGEKLIADLLLLHNHDDLAGMTQLLRFAAYQMLFEGRVSQVQTQYLPDQSLLQVHDSLDKQNRNLFSIQFCLAHPLPAPFFFNWKAYRLSITGNQGTLSVSCFQGELKYFFPDYRNYYYLPAEDQSIHKSVGNYVDPAYRENAKPANCYVKKQGYFLPQPAAVIEPVFRPCYNSKEFYFECTEEFCGNQTQILLYLHSVLQMICKL